MSAPATHRPHRCCVVHLCAPLFGLAVAVSTLAPDALAQQSSRFPDAAVDEPCEATVIRRETLRDSSGALLYVAPDVVLARDGELLLAGHSTVRFVTDRAGTTISGDPNAFVAAIRTADGRVRTVAVPSALVGASLRDLRAVALPHHRWGVLFFNKATEIERTPKATADSVWYGVLGPSGWEHVAPIPVPADLRLLLPVARPMIARGAQVFAAVPAQRHGGDAGVLLLEADGITWRSRFLSTYSIAYAGIAFDGTTNALRVLAVHPDPDVAPGARSANELYLYDPDRMPHARTRLSVFPALPNLPVHHPTMLSTGRGLSVTWLAVDRRDSLGRQVPTHLMVEHGVAQPPHELGSDAVRVISVPAGHEAVHVITSHNSHIDSVQVDIRTLPALSRGVRLRHAASFAEVMGAGRWNDSTVIVTLLNATIKEATSIATEVFWIKAHCAPVPEGSRVP